MALPDIHSGSRRAKTAPDIQIERTSVGGGYQVLSPSKLQSLELRNSEQQDQRQGTKFSPEICENAVARAVNRKTVMESMRSARMSQPAELPSQTSISYAPNEDDSVKQYRSMDQLRNAVLSSSLQNIRATSQSVRGFLQFMGPDGKPLPPSNGDSDSEGGGDPTSPVRMSTGLSSGGRSGSLSSAQVGGGDTEDQLLAIASRMGLVRAEASVEAAMPQQARMPKAKGSMTVNQVSPLGVAFKVFDRLLDQVKDPTLTTADFVARHIMPQTNQLKCRFCDLYHERLQDTPTFYVVHTWGMPVREMVDCVRSYVTQLRTNLDEIFLWVDFMCINQHGERAGSDYLQIKDIIQSADRTLFVLDRYGEALTRSWVLWELWQTSLNDRTDRVVLLPSSWCWDDCLHGYLTLDVAKSITTRDRERLLLLGEIQKSVDLNRLGPDLKEMLITGAKREVQKAEKLSNLNPRRFSQVSSAYAMLLYLHCRYSEAEEQMRAVIRLFERVQNRDVSEKDQAAAAYQLACVLREQGRLPDAERVLQDFVNGFRGMQDELYMDGVAALADVLCQRKFFTKAEMLARKAIEEKIKVYGADHPQVIKSLLQLAQIAASQKLYEESEEHLRAALKRSLEVYGGDTEESATAYHVLAQCAFHTNRPTEARACIEKALALRMEIFGHDHPNTLDSKAFQAEMLMKERRFRDAEGLLHAIYRSRVRSYGGEHHATLASMGQLSDLMRDLKREEEAEDMEKRVITTGRRLLQYSKIDKFRSLSFITNFLARRDHLLDKAAMFLAKAYIVFKEKLGSEHELTIMTKSQLVEIIDKVKWIGSNALEQAQIFNSATQYGVAEVMFKQAYSISKLVNPEADHKPVAQGLSDALFGQGKVQEGKAIMRAAGLTRKGMKQNMPASYLRWLNTRVAKYMDRNANDGLFDGEE